MLKEIVTVNGIAMNSKGSTQTLPLSLAWGSGTNRSLFVSAEWGF